jgi:hypothetical protein
MNQIINSKMIIAMSNAFQCLTMKGLRRPADGGVLKSSVITDSPIRGPVAALPIDIGQAVDNNKDSTAKHTPKAPGRTTGRAKVHSDAK